MFLETNNFIIMKTIGKQLKISHSLAIIYAAIEGH